MGLENCLAIWKKKKDKMRPTPHSTHIHVHNSKCSRELNVKNKTMQVLGANIVEFFINLA